MNTIMDDVWTYPCTSTLGSSLSGTITQGVYCRTGSLTINGMLTLNAQGDSSNLFYIVVRDALKINFNILLSNGALPCNVYIMSWQNRITLSSNTIVNGIISSWDRVNINNNAMVNGKISSLDDTIRLNNNIITPCPSDGCLPTVNITSPILRTCCTPTAQCYVTTLTNCTSLNGTFNTNSTNCNSTTCASIVTTVGACCTSNTQCYVTTQNNCTTNLNGIFNPNATSCNSTVCQARITPEPYCFINGGSWCITYFSYLSLNTVNITISSASNNYFKCNGINFGNIGQPTLFLPGNQTRVWSYNSTGCIECEWRINTAA
jgi:hypothetical protein